MFFGIPHYPYVYEVFAHLMLFETPPVSHPADEEPGGATSGMILRFNNRFGELDLVTGGRHIV